MRESDQPTTGERRGAMSHGRFASVPARDGTNDRHGLPPVRHDDPLTSPDQGEVAGQSVLELPHPNGVHW